MSERNDGGPAFPFSRSWENALKGYAEQEAADGMSLRDYLAAKAMLALLRVDTDNGRIRDDMGRTAKAAYDAADAMLAERDK